MRISKLIGNALLGTCLYGAVMNSFPTNEEKDAVGEIDATNEVERAGCAAALGLKTTLGMTQGEIVAAIRGAGGESVDGRVEVKNVESGRGGLESAAGETRRGTVLGRSQWGIRGAWDDDYFQAFGAEWVFPFGTNHLSGVVVYSQGGLAASSCDEPFVSLPFPVAMVPREGSFTVEQTSNSTAFAWWNARPGRTACETLDAQIELFRNGDYCVSTNGVVVERFIRGNPYPDVPIGQDNDYRDWVDEQVGVGLENGLYKFTASFPIDPIEFTLLRVGEESVVVTNAGEYVFLLEKGREYEFETIPYDPTVEYWMQDDLADCPVFASWWWDWNVSGEWTIGGGDRWLYYPGSLYRGCCNWLPTLRGSPDVTNLNPNNMPFSFEAMLIDCPSGLAVEYQWVTLDEDVQIQSPRSRSTEVTFGNCPDWKELSLSVSCCFNGYEITSYLQHSYYGYEQSRPAYQDIDTLTLLTAEGAEIDWENPVLDAEGIRIRVRLIEPCEQVSSFINRFAGTISLRAYSVDQDGERFIRAETVPVGSDTVVRNSDVEYDILTDGAWLRAHDIISKAEDEWFEKTSLDMSETTFGLSQRTDSDTMDGLPGILRGCVRGGGDEESVLPEGAFTERYFKAAGFALIRAECGFCLSDARPVQQQADLVYYSGHGSHQSAKLMNSYGTEELSPHWSDVDILVVAGCAVLDIKDYRASTFNVFGRRKWERKGGACSPGAKWESMGLSLYLGYCWLAPRDSEGGNDIAARFRANIDAGQDYVVAWRNANDCDEGRNACVIDCRTTPHTFWYWEESMLGGCIWKSVQKGDSGW